MSQETAKVNVTEEDMKAVKTVKINPSSLVGISKDKYIDLLNAEEQLGCLNAGGVDNWEWYEESLENYKEIVDLDENLKPIYKE